MARKPREDEDNIKVAPPRVGKGQALHGRLTPEAFAIDDAPQMVPVQGLRTDGKIIRSTILLPHPYAWLNMKVRASADWLTSGEVDREKRRKHVFDVYTLVAMLRQEDLEKAKELQEKYASCEEAKQVRRVMRTIFGHSTSPGFTEAERQALRRLDHELFWDGLRLMLGSPLD